MNWQFLKTKIVYYCVGNHKEKEDNNLIIKHERTRYFNTGEKEVKLWDGLHYH